MNPVLQEVPTSEALRQAALRASWRRDHVVGRRKRAWRWLVWGATRFGLPVVAALALGHVPADMQAPPLAQDTALKLTRTLARERPAAAAATQPAAPEPAALVQSPRLFTPSKEK